jgi:hypothetical protein
MPPVEIQTVRTAIHFDSLSAPRGAFNHGLHIHGIAVSRQKESAGRVSQNIYMRIFESPAEARGCGLLRHAEARMDRRHNKIKTGQQFVIEIKRAVGQNVHFGALQDAEGSQLSIQFVNLVPLLPNAFGTETSGVSGHLRMIGNPHKLKTAVLRGLGDLTQCCSSVTVRRVHMQNAA